jgi:hypothetical protein
MDSNSSLPYDKEKFNLRGLAFLMMLTGCDRGYGLISVAGRCRV